MPKTSSALDRLNNLMNQAEDDILDSSISSDDYVNGIEDDIASKMNAFKEDNTEDKSDTSLMDNMIDDPIMSNVIDDEIKPTESNTINENIDINVTDTGEDIPFDQSYEEELFNNNTKLVQPMSIGKKRGRKKKHEVEPNIPKTEEELTTTKNDSKNNPLYDQLVNNMIDELRKKRFKFSGFNEESMEILYEYIQRKF